LHSTLEASGKTEKQVEIMSVIRAFIAIDLPQEIRQRLDQVAAQLKDRLEGVPVRWVPGSNIHLTLKFLGDVSVANLDMLKKMLGNEVETHRRFEVSVGGIGAFPNFRRCRVVWVGVEAPPELNALQHGIDTAMATMGYSREDRPFSAHLTLGRVSRNANSKDAHAIGSVLESTKIGFLGVSQVETVHLYKSDLKPSGSEYTRLYSVSLKG
jgi:2'-5' RNA ligase